MADGRGRRDRESARVVTAPVLSIRGGALVFGHRTLWSDLNVDVAPGEFIAVLGPNGTGKTSLLKAVLGEQSLTAGTVSLLGAPTHRGDRRIGYVPQQKLLGVGTPLRARDLVGFGLDGHRWGLPFRSRETRHRVDATLESVGATRFARQPVASLSGGEQQRVRIAQAVVGSPALLLCDEPLLSLDIAHQRTVSELIDEQRKATGAAVLFVTHDVNPVLGMVDRLLYLAGGKFTIGTPDEVLRADVLSALYDTPVEVFESNGRVIVVGADSHHNHHHGEDH
jgi:zinc/manganese transport system ATP-binding protein